MSKKLMQIIEGWKNVIWENPQVELVAKERASICSTCDFNVDNVCSSEKTGFTIHNNPVNGCGCPLIAKTRSMSTSCPKGLWAAYDINSDKDLMSVEDKNAIRVLFEEKVLNNKSISDLLTDEDKENIKKLLDEQYGDGI